MNPYIKTMHLLLNDYVETADFYELDGAFGKVFTELDVIRSALCEEKRHKFDALLHHVAKYWMTLDNLEEQTK